MNLKFFFLQSGLYNLDIWEEKIILFSKSAQKRNKNLIPNDDNALTTAFSITRPYLFFLVIECEVGMNSLINQPQSFSLGKTDENLITP